MSAVIGLSGAEVAEVIRKHGVNADLVLVEGTRLEWEEYGTYLYCNVRIPLTEDDFA